MLIFSLIDTHDIIKEIYRRKIGILGCGQMGSALLLSFSDYLKHYIQNFNELFYLYDTKQDKKEEFRRLRYLNFTTNEEEIFREAKILFICVKPDTVEGLIKRNSHMISQDTLLISIAAGISVEYLEQLLLQNNRDKNYLAKIIRIMANHLCLIKESASVYSTNSKCSIIDENILVTLLKNVGLIKKVEEKQINAYTALTGSGPAFVYYFAEALIDAGLLNGIDVNTAKDYVTQVIYGASKYMKNSNEKNISSIKYAVTTPNGTTIAGLSQLDKNKFKHAINEAITSATEKGRQIEKEKMKLFKSKF